MSVSGSISAGGLLLTAVMLVLTVSAQSDVRTRFKTWNTEDGLPQNAVGTIVQTPDGYIWMATNDGLVRFDGVRFKVYQKSSTPEFSTDRIVHVKVDKSGRLWIFPEESPKFVVYEDGRFKSFPRGAGYESNWVPESWSEGSTTIFTSNGTDFVYSDGVMTSRPAVAHLRECGIDRDGTVWINDGSNHYSIKGTAVQMHARDSRNPLTLGQTVPIRAFSRFDPNPTAPGKDADMGYLRTEDSFWFFQATGDRRLVRFRNGKVEPTSVVIPEPTELERDRSGNLWIGSLDSGLYVMDAPLLDADDVSDLRASRFSPVEGSLRSATTTLFRDRDNNLWVGAHEGLFLVRDNPFVKVISTKDGLPSNNVYAVAEDSAGSIWFGAWGDWLASYQGDALKIFRVPFVTAILEQRNGRLLIAGKGHIWSRTEDEFKLAELEGFSETWTGGEFVDAIWFLSEDRIGSLWVGGSTGVLRYRDGRSRPFTTEDGLPSSSVTAFIERRSGEIWLGTTSGPARLDGERFTAFMKENGFSPAVVRSFYEDSDGTLWIGTYDSGVVRYKDGEFRTITSNDGLFSDGVFCILEDDDGWFWMNSNEGIYRARRQDLNDFADGRISSVTSAGYGVDDGLVNVEGNGGKHPAGLRSKDGRLWFPTAGGLAVIDPRRVHRDEVAPTVLIEEVKIDQQETDRSANEIVLTPGQTALEINYTGIKFENPDRLRFRYKLEGLEENWTDVGTRRTAYFSHLPYGAYTFRVIAANRDGVWNETGAAMPIVIQRPFHRTTWFYALISLLVAGVVGLIYYSRTSQLQKVAEARELYARELLESQERERSRLAMELHDSLGQSLVVIRNRALLGISKEKDGGSMLEQLKQISDASATALQETRKIAHTLHPYQIEALGLSTAVHSLIDKFENASEMTFVVDIDKQVDDASNDVAIAIYRIAQEWLTNVVKHASASQVEISLRSGDSRLVLQIADDGVGLDPAGVKKGLGLRGVEERARMAGGHLIIESSPGRGAKLRVTVDQN